MMEIRVVCESNPGKMDFGESIHNKLVGCKDYIDSNLVLNVESENVVKLFIDREHSQTIPVVTFHNRVSRFGIIGLEFHYYDKKEDANESNAIYDYAKKVLEDFNIPNRDLVKICTDFNPDTKEKPHTVIRICLPRQAKLDFDISFVNKDMSLYNSFWVCEIK